MRFVVFLAVIAAVLLGVSYSVLSGFNHFAKVERDFAGQCTPVTGIAGPEDIQIDPETGRAFISSLDRRNADARGAVHLFDINDPLAGGGWIDMTGGAPEAFKPLGIDYYADGEVKRLFVVNEANMAVELFDIADDGMLTHIETFKERRMTSPNNLVAVGPRSFYVTNDVKPGRNTRFGEFQFLTKAATGEVLYSDGQSWRVAAEGLRFANGITASSDGKRVYVAETAAQTLRIFDRDESSGVLSEVDQVALPAAPDNLTVDSNGDVWVAALPKPLSVPAHGANPKAKAPSEIIRISEGGEAETVYRDDGSELSASTAAARTGGKLLIGALYDEKFLICDLPPPAL